jgi:hypothetical protein
MLEIDSTQFSGSRDARFAKKGLVELKYEIYKFGTFSEIIK